MTKHYEDLWSEAEELTKKYPSDNKATLCSNLETAVHEYLKLDNIPSNDIKKALQTKKLGEILFRITELSRLDNINTYEALLLEIQFVGKNLP